MKIYTFKSMLMLSLGTFFISLQAQTSPNLEFAVHSGVQNPQGNGPVYTASVNFVKNVDNPSGTSYAIYHPDLKVDFALSNQQYSSAVIMGYNINNTSIPVFPKINYIGSPNNSDFTASGAPTGKGINVKTNNGVSLFYNTSVLGGKSTLGVYQMADLTINFNRPVDNPVLHIGAMGAFQDQMGMAGGFDFVDANVPVSFTRLSGNNANFSVTAISMKNSSAHPNDVGYESASGSVLIKGKGITYIKLRMSVRGDGGEASWKVGSGDLITMGISVLESDLAIINAIDNSSPHINDIVTLTIKAKNNGVSNNTGVVVSSLLPDGYLVINASAGSGSYDTNTGLWNIGVLNDNEEKVLVIHAKVKNVGSYTVNSSISGELRDPQEGNNTASITPMISGKGVCYNDPNINSVGTDSKFGITLLKRAGITGDNWPMIRKSAHMVLESDTKGFVITRMAKSDLNKIVVPVEGMMVYDTTDKCLKIYSDDLWSCFSTPTCP
ncbi:DUF11 domain-containing protein [Chryseobacterium sp. KMC2]|uniref:DUF11 domain-containing protein n=1 Tax=Chryseobacterium sp. KMC2 TaxID=2800705 RepID=UPI0019234C2E|nr:DUF11 domain-containing protein [Chryseobacterium sp. KMC2]MBL3549141.1 DUF11 domain-containing protein [Chryseobacterium sp. KMC2]